MNFFFLFVSPVDILEFLFSSSSIYLILPQHRGTIIDILLRFDIFFCFCGRTFFFPLTNTNVMVQRWTEPHEFIIVFFLIQKVHFVVVTRRLRF